MNSSESAEQIVRMSLQGMEVAAKITGSGAKNIAVMLYTIMKDKKTYKGKTNLDNMLRSGSQLNVFSLKEQDLKKFTEESKRYGVLFSALIDKKHPNLDGMVDIMVRAEDAPKINRIVDRFKLASVDIATIKSEIEKDKIEEMLKDAKERGVEVKSFEERLADEIMSKPIQKDGNDLSNPNLAKTEKDPLSEPLSDHKNKEGVKPTRIKKSVREDLREAKVLSKKMNEERNTIVNDRESKDVSKENIRETKHTQPIPKKKKNKERGI